MKRKVLSVFVSLMLINLLIGCATVQEQWTKLTPDEKARVIINDLQMQLSSLWDTGKAYVETNPKHQDVWKQKIVPLFDIANRNLKMVIVLAQTKQITPAEVYEVIQPSLNSIILLLVNIGAIKP
ncbi:MAG: hypothetical protein K6T87_15940 [Roseiflexus sp.]|uniref:hypothetical protein n=1 Tax=Roseiflexus sp. TaxID=2562120 RepID=UPI0025ED915F|nr:hypothetical protein [Roseiflexus sp.]MCL6542047.1 hypothetical protein [Roseiflexus sp.]